MLKPTVVVVCARFTVCSTRGEQLPAYSGLPMKHAHRMCGWCNRPDSSSVARPSLTADSPSTVVPSKKRTDPVAPTGSTDAVSVTVSPTTEGFGAVVSATAVFGSSACWSRTDTALSAELELTRSGRPSPLRSQASTAIGVLPTARSDFAANVPSPTPIRMDTELEPEFATTRSAAPFRSRSEIVTNRGAAPVSKSCCAPKLPSPAPRKTDTELEPEFATTRSRSPSWFRSSTAACTGLLPVRVLPREVKVPSPLPVSTVKF